MMMVLELEEEKEYNIDNKLDKSVASVSLLSTFVRASGMLLKLNTKYSFFTLFVSIY